MRSLKIIRADLVGKDNLIFPIKSVEFDTKWRGVHLRIYEGSFWVIPRLKG